MFQTEEYAGPVPPPELIQGYQEAIPNGGQQVLDFARREQEQRHHIENQAQTQWGRSLILGQITGFILALAIIGCGFVLIEDGHQLVGYGGLLVGGAGLVGSALRRRAPGEPDDY
jgi:uncharacterized membrane protein